MEFPNQDKCAVPPGLFIPQHTPVRWENKISASGQQQIILFKQQHQLTYRGPCKASVTSCAMHYPPGDFNNTFETLPVEIKNNHPE